VRFGADETHALTAALQHALDDCSVDRYGREFFAAVRTSPYLEFEQAVPVNDERAFVDLYVSELKRFIEFLESCDGFAIAAGQGGTRKVQLVGR
jgi:hypothetical protein